MTPDKAVILIGDLVNRWDQDDERVTGIVEELDDPYLVLVLALGMLHATTARLAQEHDMTTREVVASLTRHLAANPFAEYDQQENDNAPR